MAVGGKALTNLLVCVLLLLPSHLTRNLLHWSSRPGYYVMLHETGPAQVTRSPGKDTFIGTQQVRQFKFFIIIEVRGALGIELLKVLWDCRVAVQEDCLCWGAERGQNFGRLEEACDGTFFDGDNPVARVKRCSGTALVG